MEIKNKENTINWEELKWMKENQAEEYLIREYWSLPDEWMDQQFRIDTLWGSWSVIVDSHMNWWVQAYTNPLWSENNAASTWYRRNIDWQWNYLLTK